MPRRKKMGRKKKRKKNPSLKQQDTKIEKMIERMDAYRVTGKRPIGEKPPGAKK
jgi:hypothetical protein